MDKEGQRGKAEKLICFRQRSDAELIKYAQEGQFGAWEILYSRSSEFLHAYALQLGVEEDMAGDLTQEALLKAWEKRDEYDNKYPFRVWVRTILRNLAYDLHRRDRTLDDLISEERERGGEGYWMGRLNQDILSSIEGEEMREHLIPVLERLKGKDRELMLDWALGAKPREIAEETGIRSATVRSQLFRARERFSKAYMEIYGAEPNLFE